MINIAIAHPKNDPFSSPGKIRPLQTEWVGYVLFVREISVKNGSSQKTLSE